MMNKTFTVSVNEKITTAIPKKKASSDKEYIYKGWVGREVAWNEDSLMALSSVGFMHGIMKPGHESRTNDAVDGMECIVLDFEADNPTYTQMLEQITGWEYSAFMITSINHQRQPENKNKPITDRFHVIVPLSTRINPEQFTRLGAYFVEQYGEGIDNSFSTISRYWYPTDGRLHYFHNYTGSSKDASQDNEPIFLDPFKLIEQVPKAKSTRKGRALKDTFSEEDFVRLKNDNVIKIKDIPKDTSQNVEPLRIHCPFCTSRSGTDANAAVFISKHGEYKIYCHSEKKTFYQNPEELDFSGYPVFNMIDTMKTMGMERGIFTHYNDANNWKSFCVQNDMNPGCRPYLARLLATYNPKMKPGIISDKKLYNLYEESTLLTKAKKNRIPEQDATLDWLEQHTPYAFRILMNLFGDKDYLEHFLNWLAVGIERKNYTLWMIVTTPGAGKNLIMDQLLGKIIKQSVTIKSTNLTDRFNKLLAYKNLAAIDECFLRDYQTNNKTLQHIKNLTGSRELPVELKGIDSIMIPNYLNLILFTNYLVSALIDKNDRRYNVVNNPNSKELMYEDWWPGMPEIDDILNKEAEDFAIYLVSREKDMNKANVTLDTEAKRLIQGASEDIYDTITGWFKKEDWEAFRWDEIYVGKVFAEPKPEEALADCEKYNGIPSKHWGKVVEHYFKFKSTQSVNKLLLPKGIVYNKRKRDGKQSMVYYHIDNENNFQPDIDKSKDLFE